jgi:hypothetical protein
MLNQVIFKKMKITSLIGGDSQGLRLAQVLFVISVAWLWSSCSKAPPERQGQSAGSPGGVYLKAGYFTWPDLQKRVHVGDTSNQIVQVLGLPDLSLDINSGAVLLDFLGDEAKMPMNCSDCLMGFQVLLMTNRVARITPVYGNIRTRPIPPH